MNYKQLADSLPPGWATAEKVSSTFSHDARYTKIRVANDTAQRMTDINVGNSSMWGLLRLAPINIHVGTFSLRCSAGTIFRLGLMQTAHVLV